MENSLISLQNVGVCYRRQQGFFKSVKSDFWAIQSLTMDVPKGETLGVLGRNGAGKSTLLRLLAGIILPDRGTLTMLPGLRSTLLSIGVGSHSTLSGRENAVLNGMMLGATKQHMMKSLDRIKEFSELGQFFDEPIYTYSSGMSARLGFATALEVDPDVMLLDEMLSVGDTGFQHKSADALKARLRSGKTAVLVSHDPNTILDLCSSAVWIENGVSVAQGKADVVAKKYETFMAEGGTPASLPTAS